MSYQWYIIYPGGHRDKICVNEILDHDVSDYALASRRSFLDRDDAITYAKKLARENDKVFESDERHDYLD